MRVCLIFPPSPFLLDPKALPPLGVLYVSAALKRLGHDVTVLDFADGYRFVEADVYGVSITTPQFPEAVKILKFLREHGAERVVAGGPHASLMPKECLEAGFDAVGVGDGELTMPVLMNADSPRIVEAWATDVDALPHPDRTALDLHSYNFKIRGVKATSMMSSRGCVWGKCAFCSRWDKAFRPHSAEYVIEEVKQIHDLGFNGLMIYDDEWFVLPKRDRKIIGVLGELGFTWRAFGRADFILRNRELVEYAARNGLAEVLIGVESGSDYILGIIRKGTTSRMNLEAIRFLHERGVDTKCAIIIGLPGESPETLRETWSFCEKVEPYVESWDFTVFTPYPGSHVYNCPEMYDIKFDKARVYAAYKGMGSPNWNPAPVSTSKLSFEEVLAWRESFERRFKLKA
jgi:anaerobic magnesium-protoporphyrin IX monomethyl ester cyclase